MAQKTFDQIRANQPLTALTGTEVFLAQVAGVTKGGLLSLIKTWVKDAFVANDISNASAVGKAVLTAADATAARTAVGAATALTSINQTDAEAGISTTVQNFSAIRVAQAIAALAPTGAVSATQAEAEAGSLTAVRAFSPQRVGQAIAALAPAITATTTVKGGVKQGTAVADTTGAGDVVAQLNALLVSLRTAGVIVT